MGLVGGIYRATGHLARAAVIGTGQQAAVVALTLALIAARASFVDVALARVAVPVAATLYILYDLHRLHPWLRIWPSTGSWREGARMVGPGLFFLLIPAADYLSNQVVLLILQQHLHGGEVSRFATHRTVVNLAQMVSNLLISAVWFEMTALHARDEGDRLAQVQRRMVAINVWLVGAATVGMLPFIGGLYPGWTAGKLSLDWITFGLLIARVVVWSVWNASATVLWATNRHRMGAFALLGAGVVSCALGIVLVPVMGIRGGALATLVGDLVLPAWLIPRLAARQTGGSAWRVVADAAAAFAVGIAIPALLAWGAWSLVPSPLARYGLVLPLAAGLAATLMWRHLSAAERALLQGIVRTKLRFPSSSNT
jgi:O-antigen/teichoic acid export membrane protein